MTWKKKTEPCGLMGKTTLEGEGKGTFTELGDVQGIVKSGWLRKTY